MIEPYYESDRALAEYLLFHYGTPDEILPYAFGPAGALEYPVRCVTECLDVAQLTPASRALDLGCGVGRSTFELARHCEQVTGIDFSNRFIECAERLQRHGAVEYDYADEGSLTRKGCAVVPANVDSNRITFKTGNAMNLPEDMPAFDVVLMANLIDRLSDPRMCLKRMPSLVKSGGQLIISSPYTWLPDYTPPERWLGGFSNEGKPVRTAETLQNILGDDFECVLKKNLPFLIREHARKFQWSVAEASVWKRR